VDGVTYHGVDDSTANDLYDAVYRECYVAEVREPSVVAQGHGSTGTARYEIARRGCQAANLDIDACVPPIYYSGGSYWCGDGTGRHLKQP
jgi:hypothetical protein